MKVQNQFPQIICTFRSETTNMKKRSSKKWIKRIVWLLVLLYLTVCTGLYFFQESLLFHPKTLKSEWQFKTEHEMEEVWIPVQKNTKLHGLYFPTKKAKGIILYCHGNSGSVNGYMDYVDFYQPLGYDFFVYDYRGFGKSQGEIESEGQFYTDARRVFHWLQNRSNGKPITVVGYSMGTTAAAFIASKERPKRAVLLAPFSSMKDMMGRRYPWVPRFLLNYPFETNKYVEQAVCPIAVFHGDLDKTIPLESSEQLREHLKERDDFVVLKNQDHKRLEENEQVQTWMKKNL